MSDDPNAPGPYEPPDPYDPYDPPVDPSVDPSVDPHVGPPTEPIPIVEQTEPMPYVPEEHIPPTTQIPAAHMAATPTDPSLAVPNGRPDPHWYDNRAAVAAVIAVGLIGIFLLIGWLLWWSDDDDGALPTDSVGSGVVVDGSTLPTIDSTTTVPPASVVQATPVPTVVATLPPETTAATTAPTTAPTTVAPTTAPTTTPATTPTTQATTTVAPTTTSIPVVTVPPSPSATVMDILAASPDLSRLDALVTEAGLDETLGGDEPLTLFAPSNQAIETLEAAPGGADLLADPDRLRDLLLGHVVPEALDAATIFGGSDLTTAGGSVLEVDPDVETVGGATVLVSDVTAANGVLHVIDRVFDEA